MMKVLSQMRTVVKSLSHPEAGVACLMGVVLGVQDLELRRVPG